jgi:cytochrome oxidase Cu insertion factor (SCO1/SenC/PrrC family)
MIKIKTIIIVILLTAGILLTACDTNSSSNQIHVGNLAPDFILSNSDGSPVSLSEYKGQPVLLFFHMAEG